MSQSQDFRRLWALLPVFVVALLCFVFTWKWRESKVEDAMKSQAYMMAREGFHAMHRDADIPMTPHGLQWTQTGKDEYVLEADGTRVISTARVPTRWVVHLHHSGANWSINNADWKLPDVNASP